ncbi:phosphonate/phosphate ABC transporter periplasmic binding protein [Pararobbsia alpina]|uniref:phosphonate ABC transporter substrate-binding protein n=1 Tax=Pararobbsia alpina TaxID=621374 RepID=UPI0039A5936A
MKLLSTLVVAAAAALACVAAHAETVSFGIISTDSSSALKERWMPLIEDMHKQTGLDIKPYFATDYSGIIEAMRFNKVQVAFFGNKSAIEAVDRASGEVFAKVTYANGEAGYHSVLITNVDSPYKTVDDVLKNGKNVNFGMGDPESTSGTLVPMYYIFSKNHIDPKTYFKSANPSSHEANALAVINNQVDAATCNTDMLETLKQKHPDKLAKIRVLWQSPLIPSDPLVWRKDLPASEKTAIQKFFVNYGKTDPKEKQIIEAISGYSGFVASTDAQLVPIRQLSLFQDRQKIEANANLSDSDKKTQLASIDAKIAELNTAAGKQ